MNCDALDITNWDLTPRSVDTALEAHSRARVEGEALNTSLASCPNRPQLAFAESTHDCRGKWLYSQQRLENGDISKIPNLQATLGGTDRETTTCGSTVDVTQVDLLVAATGLSRGGTLLIRRELLVISVGIGNQCRLLIFVLDVTLIDSNGTGRVRRDWLVEVGVRSTKQNEEHEEDASERAEASTKDKADGVQLNRFERRHCADKAAKGTFSARLPD